MLFLACFIFKIRATLDFKVKYLRLRAHKLISPSYLIKKHIIFRNNVFFYCAALRRKSERDSSGTTRDRMK
jgi:hypothetical protein